MKTATWAAGSKTRTRGFTLLELMLVLVIASLMLTLAMPRFAAALPGVELRTYTQELAALLRFSRSQAIASNQEIAVRYDAAGHRVYLVSLPRDLAGPESVELNWPSQQGSPYQTTGGDMSGREIRFYPDGSADVATIGVQGDGRFYSIRIDWLTGSVRIEGITGGADEEAG